MSSIKLMLFVYNLQKCSNLSLNTKMYRIVNENYTTVLNSNLDFIPLLKSKWDQIHDHTDFFKYQINIKEKLIDDTYLLQLNPDRQSKRRTPEEVGNISQPFNPEKFNFNNVAPQEILFHIVEDSDESNIHTVIVNVSPITRYHSLLCPSLSKNLPQVVTKQSLKLILDIMILAHNRDLRIGFNSLCALASVNHLHYHLFIEPHDLPVESVKCKHLIGTLYCFENYPCPAFCFQYKENSPDNLVEDIHKILSFFIKESIAHNIMITRGKSLEVDDDEEVVRVLIWPRKSILGAKKLADFNVAVCELSGWFPIFNSNTYNNIKRKNLENELRKWKIDDFDLLCEQLKSLY